MQRPYWSGQLQISLVSFGIQLFPATEAKSEIHFHQLNRKTGQRIKYQNVSDGDVPVAKDEIVKGYEYSKGEYVVIEPEDIEHLRIPSRRTLDLVQFVQRDEIDPKFFERPYFISPENATQADAFAVVRKALQATQRIGLGKIAFGGREHLVGISAPLEDKQPGMMAYMLRYVEELRDPRDYTNVPEKTTVDPDQLALAKELINRKTSTFEPEKFTDEYENALRAMVEAKVKHAPLPRALPMPKPTKLVDLMDALRKSLSGSGGKRTREEPAPQTAGMASRGRKALSKESVSKERKSPERKPPARSAHADKSVSKRKSA